MEENGLTRFVEVVAFIMLAMICNPLIAGLVFGLLGIDLLH